MTQWILIGSLVATLFATMACSDSNEPGADETSGGEVGDKVEEGAEDTGEAVEEGAEDAADTVPASRKAPWKARSCAIIRRKRAKLESDPTLEHLREAP
jgi:hypothetical protein